MSEEKPNIRLSSQAEPLGEGPVTVGMEVVATLPDETGQKEGWYEPNAARLLSLYPGRYKKFVAKGE